MLFIDKLYEDFVYKYIFSRLEHMRIRSTADVKAETHTRICTGAQTRCMAVAFNGLFNYVAYQQSSIDL
jgi:hypothetical protein